MTKFTSLFMLADQVMFRYIRQIAKSDYKHDVSGRAQLVQRCKQPTR